MIIVIMACVLSVVLIVRWLNKDEPSYDPGIQAKHLAERKENWNGCQVCRGIVMPDSFYSELSMCGTHLKAWHERKDANQKEEAIKQLAEELEGMAREQAYKLFYQHKIALRASEILADLIKEEKE